MAIGDATGGSDYHGDLRPGVALGTGRGDLAVPDRVAADLRRAAGRAETFR